MYDRKPNCSYNCLIGMALKSSESGRLPVGEIYRFFEREFPYFLTAAEPWKNSLRHSLSLGHYFRKYNSDKLVTKKGHLWEVDPQRAAELDKEMYMFLARGMPENMPSSPQLSKLRLQMTQLLLDSIKNTPSSCHSAATTAILHASTQQPAASLSNAAINYTKPRPVQPQAFKPLKRPDILMPLAQARASFSDTMTYPPSPMVHPAAYRESTVGCLLASSPRAKPLPSPQLPLTPKGPPSHPNNVDQLQKTPETQERRERRETGFRHSPERLLSGTNGSMCDEAYQLIQFCNHCSLGLDHGTKRSFERTATLDQSGTRDSPAFANSNQSTPQRPSCRSINRTVSSCDHTYSHTPHHHLCQDEPRPEKEDPHYPFIVPPTGDRDMPLSQLNHASYHCHLGPPRELTVTKCRPQRTKSELCRTCRDMDQAVRPVVYDWNGWWEAEHVLCAMNEESYANYVECRSREDIGRALDKSHPRRVRKILKPSSTIASTTTSSPTAVTPGKGIESSYVTPIKNPEPLVPLSEPVRRVGGEGTRRGCGQGWMRRLKVGASSSSSSSSSSSNNNAKSLSQGKEASEGAPPPRRLVADACKSLKLIVSIPFRKLITERQMKKYCVEGGKHRIPTQ